MVNIFSILSNIFNKNQNINYYHRLALDIGTEYVKAMVVKFDNQQLYEIIGYGQAKQDALNMEGGAIADIEEVVKRAYEAVEQAVAATEVRPKELVMGIAGEFVQGIVTNINSKRLWAKKSVSQTEINRLVCKAQRKALAEAEQQLVTNLGLENVELRLINSSVVDIEIDGYRISNPTEFQGKNLQISVFSTFAPLVHVSALETIAERLNYDLVGIIAEPFAVAKSVMGQESYEFGAVVVDIGGGTTDVALIRNGGIEGTKMFSWAGRAFTRSLAREFNLSLAQAEQLKLKYSTDNLQQGKEEISYILDDDLKLLYEGLELALEKLARKEALPQKIYLCGGGSALKGLINGLVSRKLYKKLPFFGQPNITLLTAKEIKGIKDPLNALTSVQDVTPKSLALQATRMQELNQHGLWSRLKASLG